jgi:hypothetical protein
VREGLRVALGFRKSFKLAPGVRMTLSKRGVSVSGGPRGAKVSANMRGEKRASLTFLGLFWRKRL